MTEFGFIDNIKTLFDSLPTNDFEGIGDDCAILPIGGGESLLFTSDMLVENIHFSLETTSPFDLGVKSVAVNLSDVAAMGATPIATLLSLSLPKGVDEHWAEEFMRGYHSISERHSVPLVGGDTTASLGHITINVTAIGRTSDSHIKRRSAARKGDVIMVTGSLGDSAAALASFMAGKKSTPFSSRHLCPTPRIEEGRWLGEQRAVHAMMDISDGVASDIRHIMSQSGVGAEIALERIPTLHDARTALCGGEDYELLITVEGDLAEELITQFNDKFSITLTPIGEIIDGSSLCWLLHGEPQSVELMGFRHF